METKTKNRKITLGTKEWADSNVNCYYGCSNNCRYCYAKLMAIRFKRKTPETWKFMEPNQKKIDKSYNKRKGRIMFPTSHDITEESLNGCLIVLKKLLESGNEVLITTKPNFVCVKSICDKFQAYRKLVQFRFTITSLSNETLKFWEPGAPSFKERFESLKYAFDKGYKTSISIEPFLDKDPFILVKKLIPYVNESIWIGKMNYITSKNLSYKEKIYFDKIRNCITRENLHNILKIAKIYGHMIRIKDSIHNYLLK
ncbi:MAG: radical SAM protein [Candidatus Thorarchaeota archaeon]